MPAHSLFPGEPPREGAESRRVLGDVSRTAEFAVATIMVELGERVTADPTCEPRAVHAAVVKAFATGVRTAAVEAGAHVDQQGWRGSLWTPSLGELEAAADALWTDHERGPDR